jgi:hypothetical protein
VVGDGLTKRTLVGETRRSLPARPSNWGVTRNRPFRRPSGFTAPRACWIPVPVSPAMTGNAHNPHSDVTAWRQSACPSVCQPTLPARPFRHHAPVRGACALLSPLVGPQPDRLRDHLRPALGVINRPLLPRASDKVAVPRVALTASRSRRSHSPSLSSVGRCRVSRAPSTRNRPTGQPRHALRSRLALKLTCAL